nr:MAG TPA: hypothetical protein [Caudoviricetes sp.]
MNKILVSNLTNYNSICYNNNTRIINRHGTCKRPYGL